MSERTRDVWSKEAGYIWSMIGSAVGFANILSFSALCYKNGGGAFLIPYILAHLFVGIPMLFLEGIIGQRTRLPLVSAMGNVIGRRVKLFGWLAVITCATIGGFYTVLTGFAVAYTYFSASGTIPLDSALFFKESFLQTTGGITEFGGLIPGVFLATLSVVAMTWAVLARRIQTGVEKLCSIFLPLLGLIVIGFTCATLFLPGALLGIKNYLIPDFARLKDLTLWRDVFGQLFFSLSLGLGIVTGYSRHNPSTFSIKRAMISVAIGDFIISFISGLAIFGCMGFMSVKSGTPISQLVHSDSPFEIGFVIFPAILAQFSPIVARIVGPLFFFCVFIAGITGVFSIIESIAGNIEFEFQKNRKRAVGMAMVIMTLLTLPFCMGNGQYLIDAIAPMVMGYAMLIGGIAEIIIFLLLSKVIKSEPLWMRGSRRIYPYYALKFLILPLLTICLIGSLYKEFATGFSIAVSLRWSWFVLALLTGTLLARRKVSFPKVVEPIRE